MKIFQDKNGNISSKRIVGTMMITSGGLEILVVGIMAMFKIVVDAETALTAGKTLIYAGAALLGAGVIENFGKKEGSNGQ